jgi:alcohol dehydrogenase class IV
VISRFVVREVPSPAIGMALAGLLAGHTVVVTDEGAGLASEVVKRLAVRGVRATVAATVPPDAGVVIFLGGMRSVSSIEQAGAVNREAF